MSLLQSNENTEDWKRTDRSQLFVVQDEIYSTFVDFGTSANARKILCAERKMFASFKGKQHQ